MGRTGDDRTAECLQRQVRPLGEGGTSADTLLERRHQGDIQKDEQTCCGASADRAAPTRGIGHRSTQTAGYTGLITGLGK